MGVVVERTVNVEGTYFALVRRNSAITSVKGGLERALSRMKTKGSGADMKVFGIGFVGNSELHVAGEFAGDAGVA